MYLKQKGSKFDLDAYRTLLIEIAERMAKAEIGFSRREMCSHHDRKLTNFP